MSHEDLPHPLHTPELIAEVNRTSARWLGQRFTGRTTARALSYLSRAIDNPYQPVHIHDHHLSYAADRNLTCLCRDMSDKLGLTEMYFNLANNTVTFGSVEKARRNMDNRVLAQIKRLTDTYMADLAALKCALPEGFLQRRVVCVNYKTIRNILWQRDGHRLKWWKTFAEAILSQVQHPEYLK